MRRCMKFLFVLALIGLSFVSASPLRAGEAESNLANIPLYKPVRLSDLPPNSLPPELQSLVAKGGCPPELGGSVVIDSIPSEGQIVKLCDLLRFRIVAHTVTGNPVCLFAFGSFNFPSAKATLCGNPINVGGCNITEIHCDFTLAPTVLSDVGIYNVFFVAIDQVTGCGQGVNVGVQVTCETTQPTIACPANTTVPTDRDACGAFVSFPPPVASDNCGLASVTCSPPSGSFFPVGVTTVACTALDFCRNSRACPFTVTVTDRPPSVVSNDTVYFLCDTATICRPVLSFDPDGNLASVTCDGVPVALGLGEFCFKADTSGRYRFICVAKDRCDSTATDTQFVDVRINRPPFVRTQDTSYFLCNPGQEICRNVLSGDPDGNLAAVFCDGVPVAPGLGEFCFRVDTAGTYRFICRAIDRCDSTAVDTQYVTVALNLPPVIVRSGPNLTGKPPKPLVFPNVTAEPTAIDKSGSDATVKPRDRKKEEK